MNVFYRISASVAIYLLGLAFAQTSFALTFSIEPGQDVVGKVQHYKTEAGDNFSRIGRVFGVGYYQLVEANPNVNPDNTPAEVDLIIPTKFVLPSVPRKDIVVNLAELRLYYFPPGGKEVQTYPIGIGRQGWKTPLGINRITSKEKDPTWIPTEKVRAYRASEGVMLPKMVKPGPDNPLGGYRMRLIDPTYLIHGTNDASGVGRRSSSGCIRMLSEDIEYVFEQVKVGTPVRIISDPYKIGWDGGELYLEAHAPLQEQMDRYGKSKPPVINMILEAVKSHPSKVHWKLVDKYASLQNGIPERVAETKID